MGGTVYYCIEDKFNLVSKILRQPNVKIDSVFITLAKPLKGFNE